MSNASRTRPFHCGTQFADWLCVNCERCAKKGACEIESAVLDAARDDGTVSSAIAERLGKPHPTTYLWSCGEWEASAAWNREVAASLKWVNRWRAWFRGTWSWLRVWMRWPLDVLEKTREYAKLRPGDYYEEEDRGDPFGWRYGLGIAKCICKPTWTRKERIRYALRDIAWAEANPKTKQD